MTYISVSLGRTLGSHPLVPIEVGVVAAVDEVVGQRLGQILGTKLSRSHAILLGPVVHESPILKHLLISRQRWYLTLHIPNELLKLGPRELLLRAHQISVYILDDLMHLHA